MIVTAMAKNREVRYSTAGALSDAFAAAVAAPDGDATRAAPTISHALPTNGAATVALARPRRRGRVLAAAILAAALAAAIAVIAVLATQSSAGRRARNPAKLRTFVDRIENVLGQSAEGRVEIAAALTAGFNCSISRRDAAQRIASAADNRQSVLVQLGNLAAPTAEADNVVTLLQAALQHSIEADRLYRGGFIADEQADCPLPAEPELQARRQLRRPRDGREKRFVSAFNPAR